MNLHNEESLEDYMKQRDLERQMTNILNQIERTEIEEERQRLYQLIKYITQ